MSDYNMLYEKIVVGAWGKYGRREDPFKLGDADTLGVADNELSGQNGHDAKFGLSTALRKVAAENNNNDEIQEKLLALDKRVWEAEVYNDICVILKETKDLFNELKIVIIA